MSARILIVGIPPSNRGCHIQLGEDARCRLVGEEDADIFRIWSGRVCEKIFVVDVALVCDAMTECEGPCTRVFDTHPKIPDAWNGLQDLQSTHPAPFVRPPSAVGMPQLREFEFVNDYLQVG